VKLLEGRRVIGCKWVFKVEWNTNGEIDCYKAQLVAKWYSQFEGINYNETFVPIARYSSIWVLLGIRVMLDFEIHQMVVKSTFFHCGLKECFYMVQLERYKEHDQRYFVYKLQKAIYGLN
jgi:hypothetical protein